MARCYNRIWLFSRCLNSVGKIIGEKRKVKASFIELSKFSRKKNKIARYHNCVSLLYPHYVQIRTILYRTLSGKSNFFIFFCILGYGVFIVSLLYPLFFFAFAIIKMEWEYVDTMMIPRSENFRSSYQVPCV